MAGIDGGGQSPSPCPRHQSIQPQTPKPLPENPAGDIIDLLFYHLKLRCYVVIELKATEFRPEHAGQLSFYLTAVDRQVKARQDNRTIGLLLCRKQNRLVAEYALSAIGQPIGVAEYQLTQAIPPEFQGSLPTIEQLEAELQGDLYATDTDSGAN